MSCLCNPGCFEKLKSLCGNLEIPCGKASPSVSAVEAADTSPSPQEVLCLCLCGCCWCCQGKNPWLLAELAAPGSAAGCASFSLAALGGREQMLWTVLWGEALMSSALHQWSSAVLCLEMKWHYRPREASSNYSASGWVKTTAAGAGSSVAVRTRPCCPPALSGGCWAVGWDSNIHHKCLVPWAVSDCHPHLIIWALNQAVSRLL